MTCFGYIMVTGFAMLSAGGLVFFHPAPQLIWNATASTPTGLYALRPVGRLHALELVAIRPPEPLARYLADNGFLPKGVPLLKHVMALPGQTVCRDGTTVTVDHVAVGVAHERDHRGRPLPRWSGCHTLGPSEVFLMNPAVPDSLDGRYFGPLPTTAIVARAVPLWTDEAHDGRFVWRAAIASTTSQPPTKETSHGTDRSIHPR
jgi:conjugative transfer signal peptidase TraF